jgi:hypothetical protein
VNALYGGNCGHNLQNILNLQGAISSELPEKGEKISFTMSCPLYE